MEKGGTEVATRITYAHPSLPPSLPPSFLSARKKTPGGA